MSFLSGSDPLINMPQLSPEELKREAKKLSALAQQRNLDPDDEIRKVLGDRAVKSKSNFI